ncbi:MAG: NBR1-Ig-like domain-containing protein [Chloroflexota bacterium]
MRKLIFATFLFFLALPALACQLVTGVDEATTLPTPPSLIAVPTALNPPPTFSATAVTTATATTTAATPAATTAVSCAYNAAFVRDVTIPDDTEVAANSQFTKTWRVRNNGDCPWPQGTTWVFHSDNQMGGPASSPLATLGVGETADISVDLTAPASSGTYTGYWRVRLPDGTLLPARFFVRIVVPAPAAAATTAVATIAYFRADVTLADPGDIVNLQWQTSGDQVTIYRLRGGQLSDSWSQAATGTMAYQIDVSERNAVEFALFAGRDNVSDYAQANLTLPLTCPHAWFFTEAPDECAQDAPLFSDGVEQHFQQGVMIWVAAQDRIYILYDDDQFSPRWEVYTDEWETGDPVNDPTILPPAGLYQPQQGFGLLWRETPGIADRLGWATGAEEAFTAVYQTTARYKYNETYLRALDGNVWHLLPERSDWEKLDD